VRADAQNIDELFRAREIDMASAPAPLDWEALFGRSGPGAIEIGTGNGYFLAQEAARLPEFNFIGIEREPKFYYKMAKRCARAGLDNVCTVRGEAREFLERWLPPHSLDRLYCYFSDPWPKRRHRERRVFGPALPVLLERVLAPGGELWFKTDADFYFNLAVTVFRRRGGWRFIEIGRVPLAEPSPSEVPSNYERKAREAGTVVWGFKAVVER